NRRKNIKVNINEHWSMVNLLKFYTDIDKKKMSQRSLPCKVIQKKPNIDSYQVACQYGIFENWYPASEIELLGTSDYLSFN
ncbi:36155_t:CDS:1, partial [Racocetra persica]